MEDKKWNLKSVTEYITEHQIENIKLAVVDIDGVLRGKYVNAKKFLSALDKGFGFCNVIFGWDSDDVLYDKDSFTGWADGFTDADAVIDASSMRLLPTEDYKSVIFLVDFSKSDAAVVCPRSLLKKTLDRLGNLGYDATAAFEFEFFLFNETPKSIREKNYNQLEPMTPGNFGYSILRNSTHANYYHEIMGLAREMDMPLEGLHTETGAGVLEGALEYSGALRAADNGALFKNFIKVWAQQRNLMASFMAKWSGRLPGAVWAYSYIPEK